MDATPEDATRPTRRRPARLAAAILALCMALAGAAAGLEPERAIPSHVLDPERNTISVFRSAADSVVFVTNARVQRTFRGPDVQKIPQNTGSGIVWDKSGHILTNFHVIQGGNSFSVTFADGRTHEAEVVGFDANKDLAVLRVEAKRADLTPIGRGRSTELVVGQKVLAIGNPFGLDHTLTVGVISALGREIQSIAGTTIEDVIQTDASINPGNSGGPLLDSAGRMIGVNTQILSRSGQSAGIGFAVPVDTVVRIVPQLILHGRVKRAGLGIRILPDHYAQRLGVAGVIIREVNAGSPAARAGLRSLTVDRFGKLHSFDAIVSIDGEPILSYDDLYHVLDGRQPGEEVTVHYQRKGRTGRAVLRLQSLD